MKISSTFRVFAFLMALLISSMPFVSYAQQKPIETKTQIEAEARAQAIVDAEIYANKTAWFMAGCFLSILGVAIAKVRKVPVPAERLVGKSPVYVAAYTSIYQAKRTEIQTGWALLGCAVIPLALLGCVVAIATAAERAGGGSWCGPFF
jgi:hypothetical protein